MATRGRKKGEQTHIEGMAPEKNPKVHKLALGYVRARDARMEQLKEEIELKDRLLAAMEGEEMTAYEYDDINVIVSSDKTIKVKRHKKEE